MRDDLCPSKPFPDLRLPDHTARERSLSELAAAQPLVLAFVRGWWCPKEQVRLRTLVTMQEEIQREYGAIVAVTVDEPYVNGAFRAGLGAAFPFLSDGNRSVARELDLLEHSDAKHLPFLPFTFVLDSQLGVHDGDAPEVGAELGKSAVDGRPWIVHSLERRGDRLAVHLRKSGRPDTSREVRHSITAPPP